MFHVAIGDANKGNWCLLMKSYGDKVWNKTVPEGVFNGEMLIGSVLNSVRGDIDAEF